MGGGAQKDNGIRTVVADTASEIWELLRLARFGKLSQVMPMHYGPVNAEYKELLRKAANSDKNVILLHRMKSEYVDEKRTGKYERTGFGETGHIVQANLRCYRDSDNEWHVMVRDCRQNALLAGEELVGPMASFPFFASMVYPESDIGEWE